MSRLSLTYIELVLLCLGTVAVIIGLNVTDIEWVRWMLAAVGGLVLVRMALGAAFGER